LLIIIIIISVKQRGKKWGGKKRDEGEEDKKISIRRELRDVCWLSRVLSKIKDRKA
jgi:hypothetical protein